MRKLLLVCLTLGLGQARADEPLRDRFVWIFGWIWIDDWHVEEVGPLNVLHRPGTHVTVRDSHGTTMYAEGRDYASLVDSSFNFGRVDREAASLTILPASHIAAPGGTFP